MKAVAGILFCLTVVHVFADDCPGEKRKELGNGVIMVCRHGVWRVSKRSRPNGPPCEDDPSLSANGTCSADRGHCLQYTDAGKKADLDCPETCESCDACRCQDASQWHTYCPFWAQYCSSSGVLGTWMTSNCRKTCGKCKCKCCSYGGKQHQLGARISLPDKCGELICQEGLIAGYSPLLSGAAGHKVSHPEELTLNFRSVHDGADCCILPGNARNADGSSSPNGTMVQEGWKGLLDNHGANVPTTCCHGVLCTPLNGTNQTSSTTTTLTTTTTTTTTSTTTTTTTTPTTTTTTPTTTTTTPTTTTASNIPAGEKLYLQENGYSYYGLPVAKGKRLLAGTVADTCEAAGMKAICPGPAGCSLNSPRCQVVSFEADIGCGSAMFGLSKKICKDTPRSCPQMDGLFTSYKGGVNYGDMGAVNGKWYTNGQNHVAGDGNTFAYCVTSA